MSDKTVNIVYEGRREKLDLTGRTFSSIEEAVKEAFHLNDVELVAKQKDGTEVDLWDDADLEKLPTTTEILVYEHLEDPLGIKFGTEKHTLDTVPLSNTVLSKVAREVVLEDFDVPDFVGRLGEFVTYVRRAHYHLIAGGEYDLAMDLNILGRDSLKPLSEKCQTTLEMYAMTCRDMLGKLQAVFEFCRDGHDESALINLDHLGKLAAKMKEESVARAKELEKAMEEAKVVLDKTRTPYAQKGSEESKKWTTLQMEKKEMEKLARERTKSESAIENATSAKQEYEKVDKSIDFWTRIGWSIQYAFNGNSSHEKYYDWIKKWEEKQKAEKAAKGAEVKLDEARTKENDKKSTVEELEKDHGEVSALLTYLNKAIEAIRIAQTTMQKMATFWGKMEIATEQLDGASFVDCIKSATKGDQRKAMRLWRSRAFKTQGISYMARCVAIRDISTACCSGMREVGDDMDLFLTETPSRTDAEEWLVDHPPSNDKKPGDFASHIFEESVDVDPKNEQEARKCFQLASTLNTKCRDAMQASD